MNEKNVTRVLTFILRFVFGLVLAQWGMMLMLGGIHSEVMSSVKPAGWGVSGDIVLMILLIALGIHIAIKSWDDDLPTPFARNRHGNG